MLDDLISGIEGFIDGLNAGINIELNNISELSTATVDAIWEAILGMKYVVIHYFDRTVDTVKKISLTLENKIDDLESFLSGFIDGIAQTLNGKIDIQGRQIEDTQKVFAGVVEGLKVQMGIELDDALKTVLEHTKNERQILANNISDLAASILNSESFWGLFETTVDELW